MSVHYSNNKEYRRVFRNLVQMSPAKFYTSPNHIDIASHLSQLDDETIDENQYDESQVSTFLDSISKKTIHDPLFQQLYDLAAAKMISLDREIGLAVLMSYDFLDAFYDCVLLYDQSPDLWTETCTEWIIMIQRLK